MSARLLATAATCALLAAATTTRSAAADREVVDKYCAGCHSERTKSGNLVLDPSQAATPGAHPEIWEKVVRKVRAGMMPPSGAPRPDRAVLDGFAAALEADLDRAAALNQNPGTPALHRLNRTEYANAIRDLLAVEVDVSTLLPADDSSEGFDNIASALGVSPALVERYAAAAAKVSRLAAGSLQVSPSTATYRVPSDFSQANHLDGLPLGTRGGTLFRHTFPVDGEYAFKVSVRGAAIGLAVAQMQGEEVEISVDGERLKLAPSAPAIDVRVPVRAGPHAVAVAFVRKPPPGADDLWQTFAANSGISNVAITGPFNVTAAGDTPSRRRVFICRPSTSSLADPSTSLGASEVGCAKSIIATLGRRAFRRPLTDADVQLLLGFYQNGRRNGSFESGIEQVIARVLVDPRFTFRFEREPPGVAPGTPYRLSDLELASRLSFFIWSSIPDDELLDAAIKGTLHQPAVLEKQTRRMLADSRSASLVTSFGGQWLYLRELKNAKSDAREFNDNLRQAFRRETEMLLDSILREDRSILDLLNADYTFVDEALAKHYGIPGVRGSRFRRVAVTDDDRRGLLGQASFLFVTSVSNRTSPVSRGKWVLENLMGVAAPLPPPNVPPLEESAAGDQPASVRGRMEAHRKIPTCATCHKIMDPIGFSLERFDLIGRRRSTDGGKPVDATGQLVDGTMLDGPASLRRALLGRSDVFVRTATEKLLIYATGRALQPYDMPVVRAVARDAGLNDNRFSSIIVGIVKSAPFQTKMKPAVAANPEPGTRN